jgi:hypothetical protein
MTASGREDVAALLNVNRTTLFRALALNCGPYAERYGICEITISTPLGVADDLSGIPYFDRSNSTELIMSLISCPA